MEKLFKNIREKNTFIFFILLFTIFIIAFDPNHRIDTLILNEYDKLKHFLAFFIISYLFIQNSIKLNVILKFSILVFIAFFIEYIQGELGRQANFLDFLASFLGISIFFLLKFILKKFK